jgi:hypothetical protein
MSRQVDEVSTSRIDERKAAEVPNFGLLKDAIVNGTDKSLVQILKDAGYAPESARQWTNIMEGIRPRLQPTLDWMEVHRARVQAEMEKKVGRASYKDLTCALEVLTHGIQLLGGKPTANIAIAVEHRQRIDQLIED